VSGPRRVAVVGIDGAGKSSVVRRCAERLGGAGVVAMACPAYHETPDAPLHRLSRRLEAFSSATDALGSASLKAASMYLQMTLFGPVERFLVETFRPHTVLSERHALIDPIAYSPLYARLITDVDRATEASFREDLGEAAWRDVLAWQALEAERLGVARTLWDIPALLVELAARPWPELFETLGAHFRCGLPDVVVMLDLPVEVALERVGGRGGTREVHEGAELLGLLRQTYLKLLEALEAAGKQAVVVDAAAGDLDAVAGALVERAGLEAPG